MNKSLGALFVVSGMLVFSPVSIAEDNTVLDITPNEVIETAEEAMDELLPESDGELKKEGNNLVLKDDTPKDGDQVKLPISGTGKIEMTSKESGSIKIDMPDDGSTGKAQILNESTVVYPNTGLGVDTVVTVPSDNTVETYHLIRSPESPKRYPYKTSTEGRELYQVDEKTVMILGADGLPEMTISAPKATDAEGKEVPLKLTIENNQVVLYVEHDESFVYPVVADPSISGIKISEEEKRFCKKRGNISNCIVAFNLTGIANIEARKVESRTGWAWIDGGADAFRHAYWSALLSNSIGKNWAKDFTDVHEEGNKVEKPKDSLRKKDRREYEKQLKKWSTWRDSTQMDQFNNAKGRDWGNALPKGTAVSDGRFMSALKKRCFNAVLNRELMILK